MPADGQPRTGTGVVDTLLDSIGRLALLLPNGEIVARISPTLDVRRDLSIDLALKDVHGLGDFKGPIWKALAKGALSKRLEVRTKSLDRNDAVDNELVLLRNTTAGNRASVAVPDVVSGVTDCDVASAILADRE
ncbi:hypothetical protein HG530_011791 [Fusarium avenaceum]|nr:hypothetical protein HG530_011791 [Fusarium avenaceum]